MRLSSHVYAGLWLMAAAGFVLIASAVTACEAQSTSKTGGEPVKSAESAQPAAADTASLVEANNRFAWKLFGVLRKQDGNLFWSPFSVSTALAMTYAGAAGSTAAEMAEALELGGVGGGVHEAYESLLAGLTPTGDAGYRLEIANALWSHATYAFRPEFLAIGRERYRAELRSLDFAQGQAARQTINEWVARQTADRIRDLIPPNVLTPLTRLVLTNAVYFKGQWGEPFDPQLTKDEDFFPARDRSRKVPMMHRRGRLRALEEAEWLAVELPYHGGAVSMVVLLPREKGGLAKLEPSLTARRVSELVERLSEAEVDLALPRFTVTSEFRLDESLQALGMKQAFGATADFSGMDGTRELYIQAAIHKAFVEVNEEGTEAAAATGVVVGVRAARPAPPIVFRADHPFVFLIRDARSGSVLFVGRVAEPA